LLAKYGYSLKDTVNLLGPQAGRRAPGVQSQPGTRKLRQVKVYKNPESIFFGCWNPDAAFNQ
jgi:hypothetical protein